MAPRPCWWVLALLVGAILYLLSQDANAKARTYTKANMIAAYNAGRDAKTEGCALGDLRITRSNP